MPISADCYCTEVRLIMKDPSSTQHSCSACPPRPSRLILIAEPHAPPDRSRIPALRHPRHPAAPAGVPLDGTAIPEDLWDATDARRSFRHVTTNERNFHTIPAGQGSVPPNGRILLRGPLRNES